MPVLLLRFLPHLVAVAVLIAGVALAVHKIREGVRDELEPKIDRLEIELRAERADRARAEAASSAYQAELDSVDRVPRDTRPVRLCRTPAVPRAPQAPEGADGAATAAGGRTETLGEDSGEGPDIGPDLTDLARSCDREAAKLRALQGWVEAP